MAELAPPQEWVELIDRLLRINAQRREAWFNGQSELFVPLDLEVRRQIQRIQERRDLELASGKLRGEPEKILRSMQRHWTGLGVFVEHPWVPMDNNAAERAMRCWWMSGSRRPKWAVAHQFSQDAPSGARALDLFGGVRRNINSRASEQGGAAHVASHRRDGDCQAAGSFVSAQVTPTGEQLAAAAQQHLQIRPF